MNTEKINNNDNNGNNEWDMSDMPEFNNKNTQESLELFTEVYDGYKVTSRGYDKKSEAYDEIRNNWKDADVTTYYHNGQWYIISK